MKRFWSMILCLCFLLNGCNHPVMESSSSDNGERSRERVERNDNALKVYMFGDEMSTTGEDAVTFYQTRFTLGDYRSRSLFWGEEAHMYYEAIENFEKNNDVDVEVTFFNSTYAILEQLEWDRLNQMEPDVIIGSCATGGSDIASMFDKEMFYNMSSLFEEYEMYSGQEYITSVLRAGEIKGEQLLFPMSFNMNILMTSKENIIEHNINNLYMASYEEIMKSLQNFWNDTSREEKEVLLQQYSSTRVEFPYQLFEAASGVPLFSEDYSELELDVDYLRELADMYKAYLCDDQGMSLEELQTMGSDMGYAYTQGYAYTHSKGQTWEAQINPTMVDRFQYATERIGYLAEGGLTSTTLHSFAAQAYYFESRFEEVGEKFVCTGIPMRGNPEAFAATVTTFGAIMKNSAKIEKGFEFIKALTDEERHMFYDLSVNWASLEHSFKQFEELTIDFYPMNGTFPPEDVPKGEDWLGQCFTLKPMSKETSEYLRNMIEHIGYAVLPNNRTSAIVREEIERFILGEIDEFEGALASAKERVQKET